MWERWKKGFTRWESSTAEALEGWLKSPVVLEPTGALLTALIKLHGTGKRVQELWIGALGLPSKREQERALALLGELERRVSDLQEQLAAERSRTREAE